MAVAVQTYLATMLAINGACSQACPAVSSELRQTLTGLGDRLQRHPNHSVLGEVGKKVEQQLRGWGQASAAYLTTKTHEIKELLLVLACTAEAAARRDDQHGDQLLQLSAELDAISSLDDLSQVRDSLLKRAADLRSRVAQLQEESREALAASQRKVNSYEIKLKHIAAVPMRDSLTGLANRQYMEERIGQCVEQRKVFSVVLLALNGFNQVNALHGHMVGDNLLQQFSSELKARVRGGDIVGRWGGDEFIVLLETDSVGAQAQIRRTQQWVLGEYKIRPAEDQRPIVFTVNAEVAIAEWVAGELTEQFIERVDTIMSQRKK